MFFRRRVDVEKYDKLADDLMELQIQKKHLEQDRKTLKTDLEQIGKEHAWSLQQTEMVTRTNLKQLNDQFDRDKARWKEDTRIIESQHKKDYSRKVAELQKEHDLKLHEMTVLMKLDNDQTIKQMDLDHARKIQEQESRHKDEISQLKSKADADSIKMQTEMAEDYYSRMNHSLSEFHTKGNTTTKFMSEMALKMLDRPVKASLESTVLLDKTNNTVSV